MRNHSPTDPELLAGWLEHRREAAFREIVARYAGLVHATARRTCGDESMAAEVSQLTFITLARKARQLASCASLGGWLHRTALLHSKNLLRRTQRENRKRQLLAMETHSHSAGDTWRDIQPVLDKALAALTEKDREALLLRFYRALSVQEVAATLGIATDAAQKRIDRATERLRTKLLRRGVPTGTSLAAALCVGFAADAQAAVLPVSILASKAIAAGSFGSASGLTALITTIATLMKTSTWITPAVVLLAAGVWTGTKFQSLATLESGNASLREKIALAETKRPSTLVKTRNDDAPIDWQKLAAEHDNGPEKQRLFKRLEAMSREEMISALDQIASLECSKGRRTALESAVIGALRKIDPEWVLDHFVERLRESELSLESALATWGGNDLAAATAWFDAQIAAGRLDNKSLDENIGAKARLRFESVLIGLMLDSDPAAANHRLGALPQAHRETVISSLASMMSGRILNKPLAEGNHLVFANLVRCQIPAERQTEVLAECLPYFWGIEEFSTVVAYLDVIEATPEERISCVEKYFGQHIRMLSNKRKVTLDDLQMQRRHFAEISPAGMDTMTTGALAKAVEFGNYPFSEAARLAVELMEATGSDEVLAGFLETGDFNASHKAMGRELAVKIRDEQRRAAILNRFK